MRPIIHDVKVVNPATVNEVAEMICVNTLTVLKDIGAIRKAMNANHRKTIAGLALVTAFTVSRCANLELRINKLEREIKQMRYSDVTREEEPECDA